jgi:polyisoprenoid-binding protein YceI
MSFRIALATLPLGLMAVAAIAAGGRAYTVDRARSSATIEVGKAGAFSFAAGHTHEVVAPNVTGALTVDADDPTHSNVHLAIDASGLRVTGKGDPAKDVPKVQDTMLGPEVLDVQRYPKITFASTSIAITTHTADALNAVATGQLTLHGVARSMSVPVAVRIDGASVTATGHFAIKQTDFGMKPVSVGGVVSVKDALNISFTIVAR